MKLSYRMSCVALAVGLTACGGNQSTTTETTPTSTQVDNYVSPLPDSAPVVKVATTGTMPPFSFQDEYGNMMGIDIDAIRAIGEAAGFKVEFYQEPWQNLFPSVVSGHRDLAISGISYKPERAEMYSLSDSYFINPSAIMYKDTTMTVDGLYSLRGKRVATMTDSKQEDQIKAVGGYTELVSLSSTFLLYEALMQGKVDAVLQDEPLLKYTALNYPQHAVTIKPYENPEDPLSQQVVMLAKDNTKLLEQVNEGIAKIKADGRMQAIEDKWFSSHDLNSAGN